MSLILAAGTGGTGGSCRHTDDASSCAGVTLLQCSMRRLLVLGALAIPGPVPVGGGGGGMGGGGGGGPPGAPPSAGGGGGTLPRGSGGGGALPLVGSIMAGGARGGGAKAGAWGGGAKGGGAKAGGAHTGCAGGVIAGGAGSGGTSSAATAAAGALASAVGGGISAVLSASSCVRSSAPPEAASSGSSSDRASSTASLMSSSASLARCSESVSSVFARMSACVATPASADSPSPLPLSSEHSVGAKLAPPAVYLCGRRSAASIEGSSVSLALTTSCVSSWSAFVSTLPSPTRSTATIESTAPSLSSR